MRKSQEKRKTTKHDILHTAAVILALLKQFSAHWMMSSGRNFSDNLILS